MLGDQFTVLALPLLVLKMTKDTLMVGTVLAVASLPRAVFTLVGGAIVDRTSSKVVLMITKYVNMVLLGLLIAVFGDGSSGLGADAAGVAVGWMGGRIAQIGRDAAPSPALAKGSKTSPADIRST